ncbi:MAG: hypothetical protein KAH18_04955, partial [Psychromonas sp.]|nr:hypothetical protein [Psychromonas sp.]
MLCYFTFSAVKETTYLIVFISAYSKEISPSSANSCLYPCDVKVQFQQGKEYHGASHKIALSVINCVNH